MTAGRPIAAARLRPLRRRTGEQVAVVTASLTSAELTRQLMRARTWVTLGLAALMPAVLTLVIGLTRPSIAERIGDYGSVVTNSSGFTMPLISLSAMIIFLLPLAVAVFAGEAVAGEAAWGSLRYALARPVPRWRVLGSKALVAATLAASAVMISLIAAGASGLIAFGWHPLTVVDLQHTTAFYVASATFSPGGALLRIGLSCGFVLCTLASTFSFGLLLSTLTSRSFSAVAGGVGLSLFSRALDNVPGLHALGPWLPVTDSGTTLWSQFFEEPLRTAGVAHVLVVQAGYTAAFLAAALYWFQRSDIFT